MTNFTLITKSIQSKHLKVTKYHKYWGQMSNKHLKTVTSKNRNDQIYSKIEKDRTSDEKTEPQMRNIKSENTTRVVLSEIWMLVFFLCVGKR